MAAKTIQIGTDENTAVKWEVYASLVREQVRNEVLLADIEHQKKIARAWAEWRDAFLAGC